MGTDAEPDSAARAEFVDHQTRTLTALRQSAIDYGWAITPIGQQESVEQTVGRLAPVITDVRRPPAEVSGRAT